MATLAHLNVLLGLEAKAFVKALDRAQRRLKKFGGTAERAGRQMSRALTLPMAAAGGAAVKMSVDFDGALRKIIGLVGVAEEQVMGWRDELLAMAPEVGKAPAELAVALFDVTSAGIKGAAALETVRAAAMAASAGLGEANVVADAVTSAMNAYGPANLAAAKATGILVATVREGKRPAEEFASVFGGLLPFAAQLKVPLDQVGAALAHISRTGSTASEAATQVRAIFANLIKPTATAKKQFKAVGLSAAALRKTIEEDGLLAALLQLRNAFGEDTEAMGKAFKSIEAIGGILNLTRNEGAEAEKIFSALAATTADDLNKAFETAAAGPGFKLKQTLVDIRVAAIRLGDAILPTLIPIAEALRNVVSTLADAFARLPDRVKAVTIGLALLIAAAGPVLLVVGAIATGLATLGTTVAAWGVGLGAAAAVVVANWDLVLAVLRRVIDYLRPAIDAVSTFVIEQWRKVQETTATVWPAIQKIIKDVVLGVNVLWKLHGAKIVRYTKAAWLVVKTVVGNVVDFVLITIENMVAFATGDFKTFKENTLELWKKIMDGTGRLVAAGAAGIAASFRTLAADVLTSVQTMIGKIRILAEAMAKLAFMNPTVRGAAEAALSVIDKGYAAVGDQITHNLNEAKRWTDIQKELLEPLVNAKDGLVTYRSEWVGVEDTIKTTATNAVEIFGNATDAMVGQLTGGFGKAADTMKNTMRDVQIHIEGQDITATVKVKVDDEDYNRWLAEHGMEPDTAGAVI